jgi:SnoaL-like domain
MSLSQQDIHDIQQLVNLYGHIIDEREFSRVHELFADEVEYDVSDFGSGIHRGPAAIVRLWSEPGAKHPLAHHATNVVITTDPDGTVRVIFKGIGVRASGAVGTVVYRDIVTKTPSGWRISQRIATRRTPPPPAAS